MSSSVRTLALALATSAAAIAVQLAAPALLAAQQRDAAFSWSGVIASGRRVYIKDVNGAITVGRSTSGRVEVVAEKRWRRGDPTSVRITQQLVEGDLLVCALWRPDATCDRQGIHAPRARWNDNRNDVSVHFTVRVPEGIAVDLASVNGAITVAEVTADVLAMTVNGSIDARSSGGPVRASTVNGSISASMGRIGSADTLDYRTVNGSITLELPRTLQAAIECRTVNGSIVTDLPVTIIGTINPRRELRGTIGSTSSAASARTLLRAATVNGQIRLRPVD